MTDRYPHHRPAFHISPTRGYLNDPNGPVELNGELHLYYQSRSLANMDVPVEWGHATTPDLVNWTIHRPAMGPISGGLDSDGCFSGNTVLDGERVRAFYSGYVEDRPLQHTLTALSDPQGASFSAPVLVIEDPDPAEDVWMLRDPFVWHDNDGWHLVTGAGTRDAVAAIREYRSDDAKTWRFTGNLAELKRTVVDEVDTGEGWECPQIIHLDGREVALVCAWSRAKGPVGGVVAFPIETITPHPVRVDYGHSFYAPSVLRESSHGPLLFGWIMEGRAKEWWQEEGWSGAISLPRHAWLACDERGVEYLCSEPHPAVAELRIGQARPANNEALPAQAELVIPAVNGRVRLVFGDDEWVDIDMDIDQNTVSVDTRHASKESRAHGRRVSAPRAFDSQSERPGVRVLIDGSVLEVFTNGGRSLTERAYPLSGSGWSVSAPTGTLLWELRGTVTPSGI